jgi:hypothetical protein
MTAANRKRVQAGATRKAVALREAEAIDVPSGFSWPEELRRLAQDSPNFDPSRLWQNRRFVSAVFTGEGDGRRTWPKASAFPTGRRQEALRRAVGLGDEAFERVTGLARTVRLKIESSYSIAPYSGDVVGGQRIVDGLLRLFGTLESWVEHQGVKVVERPTYEELEAQRVAEEVSAERMAREADDLYDLRLIAESAVDDTHRNFVEVRWVHRGGWSMDNQRNEEFAKTFTPAVALDLLSRIADLAAEGSA